jgi:hypothetical protein
MVTWEAATHLAKGSGLAFTMMAGVSSEPSAACLWPYGRWVAPVAAKQREKQENDRNNGKVNLLASGTLGHCAAKFKGGDRNDSCGNPFRILFQTNSKLRGIVYKVTL